MEVARRGDGPPVLVVHGTPGGSDQGAATGFTEPQQLAMDLAAAVMAVEQVPDIPMFRKNTTAFSFYAR